MKWHNVEKICVIGVLNLHKVTSFEEDSQFDILLA